MHLTVPPVSISLLNFGGNLSSNFGLRQQQCSVMRDDCCLLPTVRDAYSVHTRRAAAAVQQG